MNRQRLISILNVFPRLSVTVIGDLFLDKWLYIDPALNEPSVETGLTAYQAVSVRSSAGAAGTVLNNLRALGVGTCYAVSFIGLDGEGWEVIRALHTIGADTRHVLRSKDRHTPVYMKPMYKNENGQMEEGSRIDIKNLSRTERQLETRLIRHLRAAAEKSDAVIVLDQLTDENTGVVTEAIREELSCLAKRKPGLLIFADSRAFIHKFRDITIKCNHLEAARLALGKAPDGFSREAVFSYMDALQKRTGRDVFITCGAEGIAIMKDGENMLVPAVRQPGPVDVCGAGDASTASIVSALCAGADLGEAAFIGNLASGVTVRKLGTTGTASPDEIFRLYDEQYEGASNDGRSFPGN